jgi:tRNA pseudouridine55 synthase
MMDFKEGEVLYFNKPLGWTSFKVVGHARYHICRRMTVKKFEKLQQTQNDIIL